MSGGRIDPNELAAFLENRLTPEERRSVIERLNASPEDYEAFVEAAALADELPQSLADDEVQSVPAAPAAPAPAAPARRQGWRPRPWMLLPLAAAIAVVMVVPPLLRPAAPFDGMLALTAPAQVVAGNGAGSIAGALGPDWANTGWSLTRGGVSLENERATEFRIGARLADLHLARDRGDTEVIAQSSRELAALLEAVPAGAPVAAQFAALGEDTNDDAVDDAVRNAAALLGGSAYTKLGIWSEQLRLRLLAGHAALDDEAEASITDLATDLPGLRPQIDAVLAAARAGEVAALRISLFSLMQAAGG